MRLTSDPNTLPAKVQIMNGCIMFRRSGEEIAKQIAAGRYSQYVKSGGSR